MAILLTILIAGVGFAAGKARCFADDGWTPTRPGYFLIPALLGLAAIDGFVKATDGAATKVFRELAIERVEGVVWNLESQLELRSWQLPVRGAIETFERLCSMRVDGQPAYNVQGVKDAWEDLVKQLEDLGVPPSPGEDWESIAAMFTEATARDVYVGAATTAAWKAYLDQLSKRMNELADESRARREATQLPEN